MGQGGHNTFDNQIDSFSFYCSMAPMLFASLDICRDDYDIALAKQMINIWSKASELLLNGDYYSLAPPHRNAGQWVIRQFDQPESGQGLILGIRLQEAPEATKTIFLKRLLPAATYRFENAVLAHDGFTLSLPKRAGAIWFYGRLLEPGIQADVEAAWPHLRLRRE